MQLKNANIIINITIKIKKVNKFFFILASQNNKFNK